jgi:hypothetical protein
VKPNRTLAFHRAPAPRLTPDWRRRGWTMADKGTNWPGLGPVITEERRFEKRMPIEMIIEVSGFDSSSRYFTERTETCDVSESGCQFRLHIGLAQETVVSVRAACHCRVDSSVKADLYRIVRITKESHGILIGAQALQAGEPYSFQWGALYRSLLFALLFSGMRRTPV